MSTNVVAASDLGGNPFQKYLIPQKSKWVRFMMRKAGKYSQTGNFITSRAYSVACAIVAVVLSIFNTITYLLQAPVRIILNVVRCSPLSLVGDFFKDLTSAMLSFVFVSLGVTFVIAGILVPAPIFTNFAPRKELSIEPTSRQNEGSQIKSGEFKNPIVKLSKVFRDTKKENEELKIKLRNIKLRKVENKGWRQWFGY